MELWFLSGENDGLYLMPHSTTMLSVAVVVMQKVVFLGLFLFKIYFRLQLFSSMTYDWPFLVVCQYFGCVGVNLVIIMETLIHLAIRLSN